MDDRIVLDWLGLDSKGIPYYLHFLTPRFREEPEALFRLRHAAAQFQLEPDRWGFVIRAAGWRAQLVACYALIIANDGNCFEDLKTAFRWSSFVSPQIAVTLGLLHAQEALVFLESFLKLENSKDGKAVAAAYQILLQLGSPVAKCIDLKSIREKTYLATNRKNKTNFMMPDFMWHDNFDIGLRVALA
ncbi:MAG TPA: hypothetical protein VKQ72_14980, partial [Aggregatilineales bacterium]|nr:hypothetical protein [Aggregatilineales bacterium]